MGTTKVDFLPKEVENDIIFKKGLFLFCISAFFFSLEFAIIFGIPGALICSYKIITSNADRVFKISAPLLFLGSILFLISYEVTSSLDTTFTSFSFFFPTLGVSLYAFRMLILRKIQWYSIIPATIWLYFWIVVLENYNFIPAILSSLLVGLILNLVILKTSKNK